MKGKQRPKISPQTLKQKRRISPMSTRPLSNRRNAEDEINLLKKLFHYTKEVGHAHDLNNFFEFSRKDLMKFKKTQLMDNVRRLKKKYENIVAREKSGKTTTFKTLINGKLSLFHI
ncbi:hypothetical protein EJ110_NYTH57834 [Nymphaea thermarum]|nr:hypothetical protein EJ110_NYTH57834 [Nymphaea thermarum]